MNSIRAAVVSSCFAPLSLLACSADAPSPNPTNVVTLRSDVRPVTRVEDAKPGVVIPPFVDCRPPRPGDVGRGPDGQVCTHVAIGGATEAGKRFGDYGDCAVVRTQQRYFGAPLAGASRADDPRLANPAFMSELAWVTEQAQASACTCCHDGRLAPEGPAKWAIDAGPIWTDTASDEAIALFSGLMDSSVFGSIPVEENNGFQRSYTGIPSTDGERMRRFFIAELTRRGITDEQARAYPPFGPPRSREPKALPACSPAHGVGADGRVRWDAKLKARYVAVLAGDATALGIAGPNVGAPSMRWRLDVLPSADPLDSGVAYASTPPGSFQAHPEVGVAPALEAGASYVLFVARDVARGAAACTFTYPASVAP